MNIAEFKEIVEKIGSQSDVARFLGVSRAVVWNWLNVRTRVPRKYVKGIKKAMKEFDLKISNLPPVERAIKIAGSQAKLAKRVGVSQAAVSQWLYKGYVGDRHVIKVEKAVGIPRTELNPLIYPPD